MSEREKCVCGNKPVFACRSDGSDDYWACSEYEGCGISGPGDDCSGAKWDAMQRDMRLGREIREEPAEPLEDGWENGFREIHELAEAASWRETGDHRGSDALRIMALAQRIREGCG
jgi:hypothetical protein